MKSLINWFKRLFNKQPQKRFPKRFPLRVAIVVGHTEKAPGAFNYLGESEYAFNKRIAEMAHNELNAQGFPCIIALRPSNKFYHSQVRAVANQVNDFNANAVLCLHFNSFKEEVYGCEMLVQKGRKRSFDLALQIVSQIQRNIGIVPRHIDGIKDVEKGHNGHKMLSKLSSRSRAVVLVEPVFANKRTHESIRFFEHEQRYVDCLVNALKQYRKVL